MRCVTPLVLVCAGALTWTLAGCASIETTRAASTDADARFVYHDPYVRLVSATRAALPELGLHVRRDEAVSPACHVFIAERPSHNRGYGEMVRVTLRDMGGHAEACVFTEPRLLADLGADWDLSPEIFSQIDCRLAVHRTPQALASAGPTR